MDLSGFSLRGLGVPGSQVTQTANPYMPRPVTPRVDRLPGMVPDFFNGLPPEAQQMVMRGRDQAYARDLLNEPEAHPPMPTAPLDVERALMELSEIARGQQMGRVGRQ